MDMHHDTVMPFLKLENPDVICFQEVYEKDLPMYEEVLGMKSFFKPMSVHPSPVDGIEPGSIVGVAILTKLKAKSNYKYYVGREDSIPNFGRSQNLDIAPHPGNRVVIWVEIIHEGVIYRIANTHLSVTFQGVSAPYQLQEAKNVLSILDLIKDIILCGDFNAPRGLETFTLISQKYKDNIPTKYDSTLDMKLHKAVDIRSGIAKYVVDGLFSSPEYTISNVELREGVSDHKAIVAFIK